MVCRRGNDKEKSNCSQNFLHHILLKRNSTFTEGKSLEIVITGFAIGDLLSIRSFLLAVVKTCQLFENDLIATCKSPKEKQSNFIARF